MKLSVTTVLPENRLVFEHRHFDTDMDVGLYGNAIVKTLGASKRGVEPQDLLGQLPELAEQVNADLATDPRRRIAHDNAGRPTVRVTAIGERWLTLVVQPHERKGPWLFYYRENTEPECSYKRIPLPDQVSVREEDGAFIVKLDKGEEIIDQENYSGLYPWFLLYPDLCTVFLMLDRFVDAGPASALNILLHSPQPYKGLGLQVKDGLKEMSGFFGRRFEQLRK